MPSRTFGWVQDSADLNKLRQVTEIFEPDSQTQRELIAKKIPKYVEDPSLQKRFIELLKAHPVSIPYPDLVGTRAGCNGIAQAALTAQNGGFMGDWPSNNFIRFAHAVGFIAYSYKNDSFHLSDVGTSFLQTEKGSMAEHEALANALLSSPPVVRILDLLQQHEHLTKFEIGRELGFLGENGFTSIPQGVLIRELHSTDDIVERNKLLRNQEGSSDKYARTIGSWLEKMGWVVKRAKEVTVTYGRRSYTYILPDAFMITADGLSAKRRAIGATRHPRIERIVPREMLGTKVMDKEYVRTRRAHILQALSSSPKTIDQLHSKLQAAGINESEEVIADDIQGLIRIGLQIEGNARIYALRDSIIGLVVPSTVAEGKGEIGQLVDDCRSRLKHVPHEYLNLIEMSFDGRASRVFELRTVELLIEEAGFDGVPLGGSSKPDSILYSGSSSADFGVIIDNKAYGGGFSIPINEKRKMADYVNKNRLRPGNGWWDRFPPQIQEFRFLFVSGSFVRQFESQIHGISTDTGGTLGAAISAVNLLLLAEAIKEGNLTLAQTKDLFGCLGEIQLQKLATGGNASE